MIETSKETKAQRAERLKAALNPWSAYAEIERFAREGWDSIPPEWLNTHFRWWGIYTQGDGVGAVGGTGGEFCKIALTETKGFAHRLVADLESRLPGFEQHLKIHVTGCPNSCGQHWIADLGLEGKKVKVDGRLVDAYYFCVGGAAGAHQAVARPVGYRVAAKRGAGGHRVAAACLPRGAGRGGELPAVLRGAYRRRASERPGRRAGGVGRARRRIFAFG